MTKVAMKKKFLPIIRRGEICKVFLESIVFIEQDLRKTFVYTEDDTYWMYIKIDEFIKYLDGNFLKCNRSCIINLEKVIKMKGQTVYFEDGTCITMGREKFHCTCQHFARHMLQELG